MKYTLTEENGLYRVNYIDGRRGGLIEKSHNLGPNVYLGHYARVTGNARVAGYAIIHGNARVSGDARVAGRAELRGNARVSGNAQVYEQAVVSGVASVEGDARVAGSSHIHDHASVSGEAIIFGDARVNFDVTSKVLSVAGLVYNVTISKDTMRLGCEVHKIDEWRKFDDPRIDKMDPGTSLRFWKELRTALFALAETL